MKLETLSQRKEELERRENQLKETLRMYDKYLKEDELKRQRATRKIKHESELIAAKDKEMVELQNERDELIKVIHGQKQRIADNMKYKEYLDRVVKHAPEEFTEISDIISRCENSPPIPFSVNLLSLIQIRHDTLKSTHEDLLKKDTANQESLERERTSFKKFNDEKNNEILNYTNQVV